MSSPFLSEERFTLERAASQPMTVAGAIQKTILLLSLTVGSAVYVYQNTPSLLLTLGCALAATVLSLFTAFVPRFSPLTAPLFALTEGVALGAITRMYAGQYTGIVLPALLLTFGTLFAMLGLYRLRIIRLTAGLQLFLMVSTLSIALTYLASSILGLFSVQLPLLHSSGTVGILFSLFILVVAILGFVRDFAQIEAGAEQRAPAYMEWYSAFGLLVSLVWVYLEALRLLAKLRSRD
jgi:uncharacterized YccA/Bax inhibitor family protein